MPDTLYQWLLCAVILFVGFWGGICANIIHTSKVFTPVQKLNRLGFLLVCYFALLITIFAQLR